MRQRTVTLTQDIRGRGGEPLSALERERVELVALDAEVRNRRQMLKDAGRHEKRLRQFLEGCLRYMF